MLKSSQVGQTFRILGANFHCRVEAANLSLADLITTVRVVWIAHSVSEHWNNYLTPTSELDIIVQSIG
jgi:hypothetical protein